MIYIKKLSNLKNAAFIALLLVLVFGWFSCIERFNFRTQQVTNSENQIFLGVGFGMGVKEVTACLELHETKLLKVDQYLEMSDIKLLESETTFIPVHPSTEKWETYYMPSIFLFESFVEASFDFMNDRLVSVGVHFSRFAKRESQQLVDTLDRQFQSKYVFINKEESHEMPGAYRLIYHKNEINLHLWVNLTNAKDPIVCVYIYDELAKKSKEGNRTKVDSNVF